MTSSLAVNRSTFLINSCKRFPAFCTTSSRAHAAPGSTAGTFSSTSGGSQARRNRKRFRRCRHSRKIYFIRRDRGTIRRNQRLWILEAAQLLLRRSVVGTVCPIRLQDSDCPVFLSTLGQTLRSSGSIMAACPRPSSTARSASLIASSRECCR